jgi:Flp pilus assembly CpaE family ATPase
VEALRSDFDQVIVDAGPVVYGQRSILPEAATRGSRVLLVTEAGLVSLWNTRMALRWLIDVGKVPESSLGLVVNRREGREHYSGEEVERALGVPVLAVVAEDRRWARKAMEGARPLSAGGRPASQLKDLAARLLPTPSVPYKRQGSLWRFRFASFGNRGT